MLEGLHRKVQPFSLRLPSNTKEVPLPKLGKVGVGVALSTEDPAKLNRRAPTYPSPARGRGHRLAQKAQLATR
jgi:hypothetical protein